jgi:hypothetical protein
MPADAAAQLPEHEEQAQQVPPQRRVLGKADLDQRRIRKSERVYLNDMDADALFAELRPADMVEISAKCMVEKPHSDPKRAKDGEKEIIWDGRKRAAYMIARSLRTEKGTPMYPGDDYIYGGERVLQDWTTRDYNTAFEAVQRVSAMTKEAIEAAKKD